MLPGQRLSGVRGREGRRQENTPGRVRVDSIKIMKKGPIKVPFGVTLPYSYSVLNINILDTLADDIVLHIDFRYTEN